MGEDTGIGKEIFVPYARNTHPDCRFVDKTPWCWLYSAFMLLLTVNIDEVSALLVLLLKTIQSE